MKRFCTILLAVLFTACNKNNTSVTTATYVLFDSDNVPVNKTVSLKISSTNIVYNDSTWSYSGGYFFNGLNYIFLYSANNDSVYIKYPDTSAPVLSVIYQGYRQN